MLQDKIPFSPHVLFGAVIKKKKRKKTHISSFWLSIVLGSIFPFTHYIAPKIKLLKT